MSVNVLIGFIKQVERKRLKCEVMPSILLPLCNEFNRLNTIVLHLIWVSTICISPIKGKPGIYRLNIHV